MWVLFAALSAALLLTCIWQRIQYRKLQKEIKKLLTSLDEYVILNKLSREEVLHNSKKK